MFFFFFKRNDICKVLSIRDPCPPGLSGRQAGWPWSLVFSAQRAGLVPLSCGLAALLTGGIWFSVQSHEHITPCLIMH